MLKVRVIPCLDVKDAPFARSFFAARTNKQQMAAVRC
jgi:imidazole glycerol phosphate synthase subunit HisF